MSKDAIIQAPVAKAAPKKPVKPEQKK